MKNQSLITDNGKIRKCPSNIAKMGYWKSLREFGTYKGILKIDLDAKETLLGALNYFLILTLLPFLPMIRIYFYWRKAVKEVEEEQQNDH